MREVSPNFPNTRQPGGKNQLLTIGFSCRALAEAIVSTGHQTTCVDAFGDADLLELSRNNYVPEKWHELNIIETVQQKIIGRQPDKSRDYNVLFAGGIEQKPSLHAFLAQNCNILGPSVNQVRALRDPAILGRLAEDAGISMPPMLRDATSSLRKTDPNDRTNPASKSNLGQWLIKDQDGCGGLGICRPSATLSAVNSRQASYGQLFVKGRSLGVTLILNSITHSDRPCVCLGATESFTSEHWPGPLEFIFRGCVGPTTLRPSQVEAINCFGSTLVNEFGYRGWLQIDLIEDEHDNLWLLEANPRWTAGMEILHLCGQMPVSWHFECFPEFNLFSDDEKKTTAAKARTKAANNEGGLPNSATKAIIYATKDIRLTEILLRRLLELARKHYCDIPSERLLGNLLEAGSPLLTVRETSSERMSACEALERLRHLETAVHTIVETSG